MFGSSRIAEPSEAFQQAYGLGTALARAGFAVATGGYAGVMEAVSQGAAEAGGAVFGVVARSLPGKPNPWVRRVIEVETWEQRLFQLITLGDGYVACPGATGTLVELAVAWEMMSKGLLGHRPLVALGKFWRPILEQIEAADPKTRGWVALAESVPAALEILQQRLAGRPASGA
ncbi:MAG: LOG family protein [Terriglobia bacterium]